MSPCYDLDLENSTPIFLHALQLIVAHHNTKFGSKMISSLADIVETVIFDHMSPCYDHDLENSKPIFLHALWRMVRHHKTKFGNKMLHGLEDIIWTNTDILTLDCNLELESSYPIFSQDTLAYNNV